MASQNDEVLGVLPIVQLRLSRFLNELVALPFCDVGNCLALNSEVENQLLNEALNQARGVNARTIQLRGLLHPSEEIETPFTPIYSEKVRMLLTLPDSSEELLAGFKSKLRSQVKKAERNGVVFRWAGDDGVDLFYDVFCQNMRDLGSPVHSRSFFQAIMENYGSQARIGLTEFEGKCIGAGLILSTEKQTAIPWASTLRQHNRLAPNMLLYWNFLKNAADSGKEPFDIGRSTENEGTYRFKKQWGAKPVPLVWYCHPAESVPPTEGANHSGKREMAAGLWKKLPLPLANYLGPKLRKYINL